MLHIKKKIKKYAIKNPFNIIIFYNIFFKFISENEL
jgi:hypothetical protein